MVFNSLPFAQFFLAVYILYLVLNHKWQNGLLLAASYVFYGFWDWRFLSLIWASTAFNYYLGLAIDASGGEKRRKALLVTAVVLNLAMLGFFKYFHFFAENLHSIFMALGLPVNRVTLDIVLPLGISFYTFQAMSYPIDIYRRVMKPTRNILDFGLFIAFFPQLVAGPIERAKNLLPQIALRRTITLEKFYGGIWLIFWGLFKKIFVADNLAKITVAVFAAPANFSGGELLVATYAFACQVYADFSGYSDMARGLARTMGFELMVNFRAPFFASNIYDFWQRWHISLTTWIKEYVYYPLALARFFGRQFKAFAVVVVTWAIMGFWHGPEWKFVLWGVYHGLVIVIYSRIRPYLNLIKPKSRILAGSWTTLQVLAIFHIFCVGILFFALPSAAAVLDVLRRIGAGLVTGFAASLPITALFTFYTAFLFIIEYFQYRDNDEMAVFRWPTLARGLVYFILLYTIILFGDFSAQRYYYFQF